MRILQVHNYFRFRGGEDTYFDSLVELLRLHKEDVTEFTVDNLQIANSRSGNLSAASNLFGLGSVVANFKKLLSHQQFDIVHFHNIYPQLSPTLFQIARNFKIPVVATIEDYKFFCAKGTLFRDGQICEKCVLRTYHYPSIQYSCYQNSKAASLIFETARYVYEKRKFYTIADAYIFPSRFILKYYARNSLEFQKKNLYYLPYFVTPVKEISKAIPKQDYFLYAGRLSEEKGIRELVKIFQDLKDIKLYIAGDGPLRPQIKTLLFGFPNITLFPRLNHREVLDMMKNAVATIVPSLWHEVAPLVVLESLSVGTPVLAPQKNFFREIILPGINGEWINPTDAKHTVSVIKEVYKNRKIWKKLGKIIAKQNCIKFSHELHYQSLMQIYTKVLSK